MQEMINRSELSVCLWLNVFKRGCLKAAQDGWLDANSALAVQLFTLSIPYLNVRFLFSICDAPEIISEVPN